MSGRCPDAEHLSAYHDGELPEHVRAEVQAHVAACDRCQATLERHAATSALLRGLPRPDVSEELVARVASTATAAGRSSHAWRWLAAAATVLLGAVLLHAVVRTSHEPGGRIARRLESQSLGESQAPAPGAAADEALPVPAEAPSEKRPAPRAPAAAPPSSAQSLADRATTAGNAPPVDAENELAAREPAVAGGYAPVPPRSLGTAHGQREAGRAPAPDVSASSSDALAAGAASPPVPNLAERQSEPLAKESAAPARWARLLVVPARDGFGESEDRGAGLESRWAPGTPAEAADATLGDDVRCFTDAPTLLELDPAHQGRSRNGLQVPAWAWRLPSATREPASFTVLADGSVLGRLPGRDGSPGPVEPFRCGGRPVSVRLELLPQPNGP